MFGVESVFGTGAGFGVLGAAAVLGATHALEPDHAAGISALTSEADGWTQPAFVGGSFAVGHVAVVVAWVATLTFLGTAVSAVPSVVDEFGTLLAGCILLVVAAVLGVSGVRRFRGRAVRPSRAHASTVLERLLSRAHHQLHSHEHETHADYLRTGIVGSLFALSPPVSMLTLVSAVLPTAGLDATTASVTVYAISLTAGMVLVGTGLGTVFAAARRGGHRVRATVELTASVVVFAFAVQLVA